MDNPLLTLGHLLLNRQNQGEKPHRLGAIPEQLALIPVSAPGPRGAPRRAPCCCVGKDAPSTSRSPALPVPLCG